MDDDDEVFSRIILELEAHDPGDPTAHLSEATLSDLQSHVDGGGEFWNQLAARNVPPAAFLRSISAAMDSPVTRTSLLASRAYLSTLLSASAPIYTVFTPLSFLSLLRSLRRALKPHPSGPESSPASTLSQENVDQKNGRRRARRKRSGPGSASSRPSGEDCVDHSTSVEDLLSQVLKSLDSVLDRVSLDMFPDGIKSLVETVAGILKNQAGQHHRLSDLCFRVLYRVVSRPQHGDQMLACVEVMKSLALMVFSPVKSSSRVSTLIFVTSQLVPMARENDAVRKAVVYLPRFLAMKAPEKSEPRASAVDGIVEIVGVMEVEDQIAFTEFVNKMTHGKSQLRLLAVDLILGLLTTLPNPLGVDDPHACDDKGQIEWGMKCLQVLVQRCSDVLAGIRARALTNMAHAIGFLSEDVKNLPLLQNWMASRCESLNDLLRKRCLDEKAAVRKAALLLTTKSMLLIGQPIDEIILKTMAHACSDPLVSIRKAAVSALSEAYKKFQDSRVITEWLHAVPRLISDNETSIQEECQNLFLELVLNWISSVANANLTSDAPDLESVIPEGILVVLKGTCNAEVVPCVKKICVSLGKKNKLKHSIATSLQSIITTSESIWIKNSMPIEKWISPPGAWLILSEVSPFVPKAIDWKFLRHHWELLDQANSIDVNGAVHTIEPMSVTWAGDRVSLLQTISNVSLELPPEPAAELAHSLLTRVQDFNMHLTEVDAHVKALRTLCKRKAINDKEGETLVLRWVRQVSSKALQILESYIAEVSRVRNNDNFLTPPQTERRKKKKDVSKPDSLSQAVIAVFTIGSVVLVCPSTDLKGIIPVLHTIITSPSPNPKPKNLLDLRVSMKEIAPSLYVQSWVTMGKVCLVDDKLAKRYIPLFVQELEKSDSAAIRNNIMIAMTDFCVRYTALVDCYIPKITNSLRDPCEVVRRQTFIMLSRLLQRDYVKWKGVLFLRFLLTLVDDSEKIRHLADYLFGNILKVKAPLLAYNSFVEAIFVLNDCRAHAGHCENHGSSQTSTQLFSIRGNDEKSRMKRMHIYVSLLNQMAPEQLLATSAKLCAEILAAAADGLLNIDDVTGQTVLQDALQILSCKEMRLHPDRGAAADAAEIEDDVRDSAVTAAVQAAKGRAVTQASKKNLIQHAVPIFIELKRLLESRNSPLTGCLMECLRVLLKDYKNEIEDILVADKQLQKELMYDMQRYEAAKTRSKVTKAVASVRRLEAFRSPAGNGGGGLYPTVADKLGTSEKVASAVAEAAAKATVRSVLKEVNRDTPTPPMKSMSLPRVKSGAVNNGAGGERPTDVLESLRKRQSFDSDGDS